MTGELILPLLMRWTHILAAIAALGGTLFLRLILIPAAAKALGDEERKRLREAVLGRWRVAVHVAIALLLISGFYNYLGVTRFDHEGQGAYHALMGVKMLLALVVFALAILLTSRRPNSIQANTPKWQAILIALTVAVVLIAGHLKLMPTQRDDTINLRIPRVSVEVD
jgi:uncharacterized membrane protein